MSSIDRITSHEAARTYVNNADAARSAIASAPRQASKAHAHEHASKSDSVTLSDSARALANARAAVQNAPDVREEKVADIKHRISDGTYQVSSRALARKMLNHAENA